MKVILARHGNTFNAGEAAFYVGSQQDLPLVPFGETQAHLIGELLSQHYPALAAVYTGPLLRMKATAQLAMDAMRCSISCQMDARLNELDYGLWSGLTSQEVRQQFGEADYLQWEKQSIWPSQAAWGESEAKVIERIQSFANDLLNHHALNEDILVVASNGCLRYFLTLVSGGFEKKVAEQQLKIATGHLCQLHYQEGQWSLDFWNKAPADLLSV